MVVTEKYHEKELSDNSASRMSAFIPEMWQSDLYSATVLFLKKPLIQEVSLEICCGHSYCFHAIIYLQMIYCPIFPQQRVHQKQSYTDTR